jgi:DNA (cytosine-5)-methyltransferase 1
VTLTLTDLFAGFGGASSGAVQVDGVELVIAANHWPLAVEVHNSNHPTADHACVDLHLEDPGYFPKTDILWASPECTQWSQANGKKPDLAPILGGWSLPRPARGS